jgi:hypothetical protein
MFVTLCSSLRHAPSHHTRHRTSGHAPEASCRVAFLPDRSGERGSSMMYNFPLIDHIMTKPLCLSSPDPRRPGPLIVQHQLVAATALTLHCCSLL